MDLSKLIAASNEMAAASQATAAGVQSAYGSAIAAANSKVGAEERIGVNNAIIKGQEAAGLLEAQENARKFAEAAGTNIGLESEILTILGQQQRELALDVLNRSERVQRLDDVAHLGNPLGIIYDAFFGESERSQLDTARENLASVTSSIQGLNQSTREVALTQNAIAETVTDATVAATADLQLDMAAKAAADARMQAATLNVDMLTTVNQLNRQQLDDKFRIFQAQEMAEQRAFQRERTAALRAEREAQEDYDAARVRDFNAGAKALGVRPVQSAKEIPTAGAAGERARFIMDKGYEFNQTGKLTFGQGSPLATLNFLKEFENAQIPELQQESIRLAQQYQAEYATNPLEAIISAGLARNSHEANQVLAGARTQQERLALMDGVIQAKFEKLVTEGMNPQDTTHPLAMAPIGNAAGSPILEENPVLAKYVAPLVNSDPDAMFDPAKILELTRNDVLNGEFTTADVVDGIHSMGELLSTKTTLAKGFHTVAGFPPVQALNLKLDAKIPRIESAAPGGFIANATSATMHRTVNIWNKADLNKYAADYYRRAQSLRLGSEFMTMMR